MKEKLELYLDELVLMLKDGGVFAMEQLPLFLQEYLTYYAWYHGILSLLLPLGFIAIYALYLISRSGAIKKIESEPLVYVPTIIGVAGFASFVSIMIGIVNVLSFLKVVVAPRVYIIENLTNIL